MGPWVVEGEGMTGELSRLWRREGERAAKVRKESSRNRHKASDNCKMQRDAERCDSQSGSG